MDVLIHFVQVIVLLHPLKVLFYRVAIAFYRMNMTVPSSRNAVQVAAFSSHVAQAQNSIQQLVHATIL